MSVTSSRGVGGGGGSCTSRNVVNVDGRGGMSAEEGRPGSGPARTSVATRAVAEALRRRRPATSLRSTAPDLALPAALQTARPLRVALRPDEEPQPDRDRERADEQGGPDERPERHEVRAVEERLPH